MEFNRRWPKPLPFPGALFIHLSLSFSPTHTHSWVPIKYQILPLTLHLQNEIGNQEIVMLPFKTVVSYLSPRSTPNVCWVNLSVNTHPVPLFSTFKSSLAPNCTVLGRSWFTVDPWKSLAASALSYFKTSFYAGQSDLSWTHIQLYHCSKTFYDSYYP